MALKQIHVRKDKIANAATAESPLAPVKEGAIRLEVESFSVTANNVTYAAMGDGFGYWNFFPPSGDDTEGLGIVPMWGHAKVIESNCEKIGVGERVYGYLPMASHLDVIPGKITEASFVDMAPHRQPMSPIYNQYARLAADPEHDPAKEAERMIYGPLFKTGFLIEYFLRKESWFGAREVILTSASSKTAMGLASVAKQLSPGVKRVALTSESNADFVEDSGLYDKVHTYDEIGHLPLHECVTVDFAGNAEVLTKLHEHFNEMLQYSCLVGATHIEARSALGGAGKLPGPKPTLFFAPDHAVAFFKEHGPQEGAEMIAGAWHGFLDAVDGTVTIETRKGLDAARATFVEMAGGTTDPSVGVVIEP